MAKSTRKLGRKALSESFMLECINTVYIMGEDIHDYS